MEGGKPENPGKNPQSRDENQKQTQPTYYAWSGNRTRDSVVGGERSHHCIIPAPHIVWTHHYFIITMGVAHLAGRVLILIVDFFAPLPPPPMLVDKSLGEGWGLKSEANLHPAVIFVIWPYTPQFLLCFTKLN